jgi:hypothetical protein
MNKKIIAMVMTLFVFSSTTVAFADEKKADLKEGTKILEQNSKVNMNKKPLNDRELKTAEGIKDLDKLNKANLSFKAKNVSAKKGQAKESYSVEKNKNRIVPFAAEAVENTDPNNAFLLNFQTVINANISVQGEQRWYNLAVDKNTRIATYLTMGADADFDLYLFKLDQSTMQLNLVKASESAMGQSEIVDGVVEPGIYYFMVSGYQGSGSYQLVSFGANSYIDNELNDTAATATTLSNNNFTINGAIDNPYDYDFYKAQLTSERMAKFNFTQPSGSGYKAYISTDGTNFSEINAATTYHLNAGTYYFVVASSDGSFNNSNPYNLQLSSVGYNSNLLTVVYTNDLTSFFQVDSGRTNFYVNGNPINFSYSYENHVVNSAGWIDTYMNLYQRPEQNVAIYQSEVNQTSTDLPCFVKYQTNFAGGGSRSKALLLTVFNTSLSVNRYAGGAYAGEKAFYTSKMAEIVIDIDTGKVIDLVYPNYYYMYGNQSYTITKPYPSTYNSNLLQN